MTRDFRLCAKIVGGSESSALGNIIMREKLNQRVSFVAFFKVGKKEVSLNSKPIIFVSLACWPMVNIFSFSFVLRKRPILVTASQEIPPYARITTVMYFPFPPPFPFPALWCQMRRTLSLSIPHTIHTAMHPASAYLSFRISALYSSIRGKSSVCFGADYKTWKSRRPFTKQM